MNDDDDDDGDGDDEEEETPVPAKRIGRTTDHVIVNDDERRGNHLTTNNNKRSLNERPYHRQRQRNITITSFCDRISNNNNNKKSTAARRRRQRTLLWIIQFIVRSGVFLGIPFIFFFWNASNVIRIQQQRHINFVATTAGRESSTAEPTEYAEEVDGEKTKTIIKIEELSFMYANTTYNFRYHPSKIDEIIQRSWRSQQQQEEPQQHWLPTIMFGVLSTSKNRQMRRGAIRSTWGKHVPLFFLVAEPFDNKTNNNANTNNNQPEQEQSSSKSKSKSPSKELLVSEFQKYGDLLWLDVPEDYRNALTPKSFMFMQFVRKILQSSSQSNSHSQSMIPIDYIFKTDDDVWVNATEMSVELLQEHLPAYYGMNMSGKPIRDPSAKVGSKWVLTKQEYPRDDYPPYASGLGYALSTTTNVLLDPTNSCINDTMSSMNAMPWEDVATGLLSEACHVPLTSSYKYWTDLGNGTYNPYLPWEPLTSKLKDGNTIVKIIHKPRPHWYNALMIQGSLEQANTRYEEQRKQARQAQRQQRKEQQQERQKKQNEEQ
mmetsp:Transcript_6238/g.15687  ORF Transcript_6238/g.15687 Transcript_6238/m.15687 type:complete len:545 (+) Transcript_6238:46-1680(+)